MVSAKITNFAFVKRRSDARVAEEARLESVYTPKAYPEFESRSLRNFTSEKGCRDTASLLILTGNPLSMCDSKECIRKIQENLHFIQEKYEVTGLCLFGSMARGDNGPDSDVDILVDMPPKIFTLSALHRYLENLLQASVDLIRRHSHLSPQFLNQIDRDGIKIL